MYYRKKEGVFIVVFALLVVVFSLLFLVNKDNNVLTGAAISSEKLSLGVPEENNVIINSSIERINLDNISNNSNIPLNSQNSIIDNVVNVLGFDSGSINIQEIANETTCGGVNRSITLTANILVNGTCFEINASNIVIDGNGTVLTGNGSGYGFNNTNGFDNITIKNFAGINNFTRGIYFEESQNSTLFNNTIISANTSDTMYGIYVTDNPLTVDQFSYNINIINNLINVSTNDEAMYIYRTNNSNILNNLVYSYGYGIEIVQSENFNLSNNIINTFDNGVNSAINIYIWEGCRNLTVYNNTLYNNNRQCTVLSLVNSNNNLISNNIINSTSGLGWTVRALSLGGTEGSNNNLIYNNILWTNDSDSITLSLSYISHDNYFLNNNITALNTMEIMDATNDFYLNYLIYNNSFGKIEWIDNGTGSFPRNLSLNGSLGLGINLLIDNNSVGLNISAFNLGNINSSANITLRNIGFARITQIYLDGGYDTNQWTTIGNGTDCKNTNCFVLEFGLNRVVFNTTYLGSFALNGTPTSENTLPNTTQMFVNASSSSNRTTDDLFCYTKGEDAEQDILLAYWTWYKEGVQFSSGSTELRNNTLTKLTTITADNTEILQNWTCSVRMYDGLNNETDLNNNSLTVSYLLCGDPIVNTTTLIRNITGCINIGLNVTIENITLDCNNSLISGTNGLGINVERKNNVTIKNCYISGFRSGIKLSNVIISTIQNNTLSNSTYAGIELQNVNNSLLLNNYISDIGSIGLFMNQSSHNLISNNTILRNNGTSVVDNVGYYYEGGISIFDYWFSANNTFRNNNLSNNKGRAFYVQGANHTFIENYIYNNSVGYWLYIRTFCNLTNDKLFNNTLGINISASDYILGTGLSLVGNNLDLNLIYSFSNATFINSTFTKGKLHVTTDMYAYFRSYIDVNVTNNSGIILSGATVKAYNSINGLEDSQVTDVNGFARLTVTEFYRSNEINYYLTPSIIKVSKGNYTQNSTSVNLINKTQVAVNLSINYLACGSSMSSDFSFGGTYNCNGLGFTPGNNVIIEGQGNLLLGNGSGIGFNASRTINWTVTSLTVQNYSYAFYMNRVNNTNLTGLRVINNSYGIYFLNSTNNKVYDSFFANNSLGDVYANNEGGTNNYFINVSINASSIVVGGTSTVYVQWYVTVNATYNGGYPLPNANVTAFNISSIEVDSSALTNNLGIARLILSEYKKNVTGLFNLTPHNITLVYTYNGQGITNSTTINLMQTNNTNVNLSISLNCTAPTTGMQLNASVTLCPGTFNLEKLNVSNDNITINCDGTTLQGSYPSSYESSLLIRNRNNISIYFCVFKDYYIPIIGINSYNLIFQNLNLSSTSNSGNTAFDLNNIKGLILNNNSFYQYDGMICNNCSNFSFLNNIIDGADGIIIYFSNNGIIINNTFKNLAYGISFGTFFGLSNNISIYNNSFSSIRTAYISYAAANIGENITFYRYVNVSNNLVAQGNSWDVYCDKGADNNGDGYADAATAGTSDWPFTNNMSSKFSLEGGSVIDYGPRKITCPADEVYLGSSSSSTTASTVSGAAPPAPVVTTQAPPPVTVSGSSIYNATEAAKNLNTSDWEVQRTEGQLHVYLTLENTGNKSMELNPELQQDVEDPLFVITKKTLGAKGSVFNKLAGLSYSENAIAGKLLKSVLLNTDKIVIPPGEKVEKVFDIKEGLGVQKQLKIEFKTLGETVMDKDIAVQKRSISAAAVDVNSNLVDVYALIIPEGADTSKAKVQGGLITGAAISDLTFARIDSPYYLELSMVSKKDNATMFSDYYGPYKIKSGESFLFAQQLNVDLQQFKGDYIMQANVFHGNALLAKNEFDVHLGEGEAKKTNMFFWLIPLGLLVVVILQSFYFMHLVEKK